MKHYSKLEESKISSKTLYEGVLNVKLDTVQLINNKTATRIYLEHRGASGILPIENGYVYLVEQFRYPIGVSTWEIPAGKREENQTFLECAKVELKQETGLTCKTLTEILTFHPCNAFSNEIQHLFLAEGLERGEDCPDEDEFINVQKIPLQEAYNMIETGKITDAKTILSLQWYAIHRKK